MNLPEELEHNEHLDDQHHEDHDLHEEELRELQKQEYLTILQGKENLEKLKDDIDPNTKNIPASKQRTSETPSIQDPLLDEATDLQQRHQEGVQQLQDNITTYLPEKATDLLGKNLMKIISTMDKMGNV